MRARLVCRVVCCLVCFEGCFCEELALMYIHQDDYDRARHYAGTALHTFLQVSGQHTHTDRRIDTVTDTQAERHTHM